MFFRLDPVTGEERGARDAIRALVDRLAPIAERLGDGPALAGLDRVLERGTVASTMRKLYRRKKSFPALTRWAVEQTVAAA
ncbi:MAG: hypothetical protein HY703_00200 [Gemmatimonadetes bacterium]|nr:hypothetical protein [Gemmatimonadota bacterium]